jgi:ABC-2 type transport system ATP-binding protein
MIVGLDHPTAGDVRVNGQQFRKLAWPMHEVGALLEAKAIHPGRTAWAHLWMLAATNKIPRQRVDEVLEIVGLSSVAHQRVGKFSLGMGQRLGIAVALLGDPGIFLFDEPVNGLDPDGIRWVRNLLLGLAKQGRTVFVSSHLMSEMALMAEEVIVIGRGRLIAQMSVDELVSGSTQSFVRVRSPDMTRLQTIVAAAGAAAVVEPDGSLTVRNLTAAQIGDAAATGGVVLHELSPQSASLEEAFMELTEGSIEYQVGAEHATPGPTAQERSPA